MGREDFRHYLQLEPFRPFSFTLSNGRKFVVRHPEFLHVGRASVRVSVQQSTATEVGPDHYVTVAMLHVVEMEHIDL